MKNRPFYICLAGHTNRHPICECRKTTVLKASPEGQEIVSRFKDKPKSYGYHRSGKSGVRQKHFAHGESEIAEKL